MAIKSKASPKAAPTVLKKVPLRVRAEGAREVVVTGDFTKWAKDQVRLTRAIDGEWFTLLELAPGEYQYRLLIDGQWRDHAEATRRVGNPFGSQNCVLTVA